MDSKVISPPPSPPPPPPPLPTTLSAISHLKKCNSKLNQQPPHYRNKAPIPPLHKAKSWSPDIHREELWLRQKENHRRRIRSRTISLTDSDFDELKACFELGFAFESSAKLDPKLSQTFPALGFYHDVLNKKFITRSISRSSSLPSIRECDSATSSPNSIIEPGDDPEMVKMRLRHWAQAVACSLRVPSPK